MKSYVWFLLGLWDSFSGIYIQEWNFWVSFIYETHSYMFHSFIHSYVDHTYATWLSIARLVSKMALLVYRSSYNAWELLYLHILAIFNVIYIFNGCQSDEFKVVPPFYFLFYNYKCLYISSYVYLMFGLLIALFILPNFLLCSCDGIYTVHANSFSILDYK